MDHPGHLDVQPITNQITTFHLAIQRYLATLTNADFIPRYIFSVFYVFREFACIHLLKFDFQLVTQKRKVAGEHNNMEVEGNIPFQMIGKHEIEGQDKEGHVNETAVVDNNQEA